MNRVFLASLTLLPAIPAALRFARAVRTRSDQLSRSIIVWGALTMFAGVVVYACVAVSAFPGVAAAAPEEKAKLLSTGLDHGSLALSTGLLVGGILCILGGITRSLFKTEVKRSQDAA